MTDPLSMQIELQRDIDLADPMRWFHQAHWKKILTSPQHGHRHRSQTW